MNNIRANEFIRDYNIHIQQEGERNHGIAVGMLLALRIMGYDAECDDDGYAVTLKDAKRWCDIADGKLQDVAEQNPDTFMTATYILQLRTDTWETYTLTRYYG